jgi:hypothetical protein
MSVVSPATTPAPWPRLLVAAGVLATLAGFVIHETWRALPAERVALSLVLALFAWTLAWPLKRWLRGSWATALVAVWLVALMVYVGPLPMLAAGALGLGALSIGLWLTPQALPARAAVAAIVGLAVIAGLSGWVVTLPIHTVWLWSAVLLSLIASQRHALLRSARTAMAGWNEAVATSPRAAMLCVMLMGLASTACWLPAMQMDDLTYHLGLPTQLMRDARYAPAPQYQVWSFAPWAGDVLHGIASVLSRREAHGAVNALWLILAAGAAWSVASSLRADATERWASLALFASLPPLVWIAAGMQTELAATAVTLALVAMIVADAPGRLWAGTVLFAGLFALKPVHGMAALPLLLYAGWKHWPLWPWRRLAIASLLFAALGLSSYAQSWLATGNPVLPIFNSVFQSPYFPSEQFSDPRWHAGFGPDLPWRITFDTDRYVEGWDGGFGFVLIACSGLWLLQLLRPGRRLLMLAITAAVLLPLMPMQYARYAFPCIAVLTVLLPIGSDAALGRRAMSWLIVGVCALNLAYQANASWLHHSAALKRTIRSPFDDTATLQAYLPERLLLRGLPKNDTGLVLATDPARGFIAELGGRGRTVSPHSPSLQNAFKREVDESAGAGLPRFVFEQQIRWVLVNADTASPALRAGLQQAKARLVVREGHMELWQVDPIVATTGRTP